MSGFVIRIDRTQPVGLVEQLVKALKFAISSGRMAEGAFVPGIGELAELAGVSEKVSRQALARLAEAGWIVSRRGKRSIVSSREADGRAPRGRVLLFTTVRYYSYYFMALFDVLRDRLGEAGWEVSVVMTGRPGAGEFSRLGKALSERWDLIVECGEERASRRMIESSGMPFVILGNGSRSRMPDAPACVGRVDIRGAKALPDFVRACVRKRVRSVLQVVLGRAAFDASEMLKIADIRTETLKVGYGNLDSIMTDAVQVMLKRIDGGRPLPDVVLFTDDYLARGGLIALASRGIRIPEDIQVVTFANRGHAPVWVAPLARLEMDPVDHGKRIAREVLRALKQGAMGEPVELGTVWKDGATF